jgi:hypothetical protein
MTDSPANRQFSHGDIWNEKPMKVRVVAAL